ncbi:hypothetical protein [Dongia sp.]|uniref:hypothetical protein n=1 Tax=Dongia sp. TaxID=1977262 RepID=UPI0035B37776
MKAYLLAPGGGLSHYLQAVMEGLLRHGVQVFPVQHLHQVPPRVVNPEFRIAICWGWRRGKELQSRGYDVLLVERGYIGDRRDWTSLAWNGLNGRGDFCLAAGIPALDVSRSALLGSQMQDWRSATRRRTDTIFVMGQVMGDQSLQGRDLTPWYRDVFHQARQRFGMPVLLRPHPVAIAKGRHASTGLPESRSTLADDLARAWAVITWNSNSAVDAVLAGVPALAVDQGSMAWDVTAHDLCGLGARPEREEWAARVAWCQWRIEELRAGSWWERMAAGVKRRDQWSRKNGTRARHAAAG